MTFRPWPNGPVDKFCERRADCLPGAGRRPNEGRWASQQKRDNGAGAQREPGTIVGLGALPANGSSKGEVGKVHRWHDPHVRKRLGCVLRAAMEDMAKEELPHDLGQLLSHLAELEVTGRPRRRPAPDKR